MSVLIVDGLTLRLDRSGDVNVVDDVGFTVRAGKITALVGESGSGKTLTALSLLQLLPTAARVVAGRAQIVGTGEAVGADLDLLKLDERSLRSVRGRRVAMVFQEPMTALNPLLRIDDQVGEGLEIHRGLSRRLARQGARLLLEQVGIASDRANAFPHQLSGGQRQRAMIACALAAGPEFLIADEPTTALDVTVQAGILALLQRLAVERQLGVLLITHDLGVVAEVADDVCVLYAGRVVERGAVDVVFAAPLHPYTQGLLASSPSLAPRGRPLPAISGAVPPVERWPSGCRFRDRCPRAIDACAAEPALAVVDDRDVCCWRVGEP